MIWKNKAGKTLPASVVKELMESLRLSIEAGDEHPVGRTAKPVTGFRGRSGRTFRAKLKLEQNDEGKWRVEFDEDWAREPRPQPPAEDDANGAATESGAAQGGAPAGDGSAPEREPQKTA